MLKARVADPSAAVLTFVDQKTMYGGKRIAEGDTVYVFDSEHEGGRGLVLAGVVTGASATPPGGGARRETPRVSVTLRRTAAATRPLGRTELRAFRGGPDDRPETELHFKFYRQATNKIGGISRAAADFLRGFFD